MAITSQTRKFKGPSRQTQSTIFTSAEDQSSRSISTATPEKVEGLVNPNQTAPFSIFVLELDMRLCDVMLLQLFTIVRPRSSISINRSASLAAAQESHVPKDRLALQTRASDLLKYAYLRVDA
jgi:hypothetical protein